MLQQRLGDAQAHTPRCTSDNGYSFFGAIGIHSIGILSLGVLVFRINDDA
jgi:hypothetical protein